MKKVILVLSARNVSVIRELLAYIKNEFSDELQVQVFDENDSLQSNVDLDQPISDAFVNEAARHTGIGVVKFVTKYLATFNKIETYLDFVTKHSSMEAFVLNFLADDTTTVPAAPTSVSFNQEDEEDDFQDDFQDDEIQEDEDVEEDEFSASSIIDEKFLDWISNELMVNKSDVKAHLRSLDLTIGSATINDILDHESFNDLPSQAKEVLKNLV